MCHPNLVWTLSSFGCYFIMNPFLVLKWFLVINNTQVPFWVTSWTFIKINRHYFNHHHESFFTVKTFLLTLPFQDNDVIASMRINRFWKPSTDKEIIALANLVVVVHCICETLWEMDFRLFLLLVMDCCLCSNARLCS